MKNNILQFYLKYKFSRKCILDKNITFSKDFIVGKNCKIGNNTIIGENVIIKDNVQIASYVLLSNIMIGKNSIIDSGVKIIGYGKGKIIIGKESYIGVNNVLDYSDNINVGNYVHIAGPSTGIWTHSSSKMCLNSIPIREKNIKYRPCSSVKIDNNVYIGGNCTIYPGVTINHHSIIAPNSAVNKDVESYILAGGVPVQKIKNLHV
ncbi:MAG: hypothetical protein KAT68_06325 [Bacteroidales bacterium]|nr:hypothetical protein [Bacteroidales bacterium]